MLRETDDNFDRVFNDKGTESIKIAKGAISQDGESTTITFNDNYSSYLEEGTNNSAQRLYEFAGRNTDVEFAKIDGFYLANVTQNISILTTSHDKSTILNMGKLILNLSQRGFVGKNISHIHPSGIPVPSYPPDELQVSLIS